MVERGTLSRAGMLAASFLTVMPGRALAQTSGVLFPPSIAITNYDRVLVGQEEALEAGAFVARVGDTTSGWYNPAGMASVARTAIGASASGFETDVLSLEGVGKQRGGGMSIYQLPSFFGAVLGKDVIDSEQWRIGLTITKPTSWNQEIVGGLRGEHAHLLLVARGALHAAPDVLGELLPLPLAAVRRRDRRRHHLAQRDPDLLRAGRDAHHRKCVPPEPGRQRVDLEPDRHPGRRSGTSPSTSCWAP